MDEEEGSGWMKRRESGVQRDDVVVVGVAGVIVGVTREQPLVHVHGERHGMTPTRHVPDRDEARRRRTSAEGRAAHLTQDRNTWLQERLPSGTHVFGYELKLRRSAMAVGMSFSPTR